MTDLLPDSWTDLNANQRDILTVLAVDGPSHGGEIHAAHADDIHSERRSPPKKSTIYRNVATLRELGYVEQDDSGANRLTVKGRNAVHAGIVNVAERIETEATA